MKNRRFGRRIGNSYTSPSDIPALEVNEAPIFKPASGYPYRVDLKSLVSNLGLNGEVNILSVEQISASGLATEWSQDNKFVRINRRGVITYRPKGTYLTNRLIIEFEAGDLLHPPTRRARRIGRRYESFGSNRRSQESGSAEGKNYGPPLDQLEQFGEPVVATVALQLQDDVIGDPEKEKEFWQYQGSDPTCLVAAVAAVLASLGITVDGEPITYLNVLAEVAVKVDENGNQIGELPPYLSSTGLPEYEVYTDPDGNIDVEHVYANSDGWHTVHRILNHYGVETHTGYAKHFSTIINELEAENKVIAYIDSTELWNSEYITRIQASTDAEKPNGENGTPIRSSNHAIWITGIDYSDPDNPMIIINDPAWEGARGAGARYPLERFLASWEDSKFIYTATSEHAPDLAFQMNRREIERRLDSYFVSQRDDTSRFLIDGGFFLAYIQNPILAAEIEIQSPGTRELIRRYIIDLRSEEQRILNRYNIDPELIESIYFNVDVSEWLLQNPPE